MRMEISTERFALRSPFRTARGVEREATLVTVHLFTGTHEGRGEAAPAAYRGETVTSVAAELKDARQLLSQGSPMESVLCQFAPGAARKALEAAWLDLRAKCADERVWTILGIDPPAPVQLTATIGLDAPEAMAAAALRAPPHSALKLKLGEPETDESRICAVRAACPQDTLLIDANQGWTYASLTRLASVAHMAGVSVIEQPLPTGRDTELERFRSPVPLYADESCNDRSDLRRLAPLYQGINIKLEKCGGVIEAIALAEEALMQGLEVMVGGFITTSLGLAPATLLSGRARFYDLDGPAYLTADREHGFDLRSGWLEPPARNLWG